MATTSIPTTKKTQQGVALAERINQLVVANQRGSERHQKEVQELTRMIKRTFILVGITALAIALVADILSIWDCGWIVSWLIPCFTFFMARRIKRINHGAQRIGEAQQRADREVVILQQRLQPALSTRQRSDLLQRSAVRQAVSVASSYITRYVVTELGTQGLELIPALDWLPMYLGSVVKVMLDQYNAYQKARKLLPPLQKTLVIIEQLEAFEISYLTQQLAAFVQVYQQQLSQITQQQRAQAIQPVAAPRRQMRDVVPAFQMSLAPA